MSEYRDSRSVRKQEDTRDLLLREHLLRKWQDVISLVRLEPREFIDGGIATIDDMRDANLLVIDPRSEVAQRCIGAAIADPGRFTPRRSSNMVAEPLVDWQRRAVLLALADYNDGQPLA